ncbi:MAG: general stress protein [Pseudochelatococcus sp.]|uniref:general stress protein n=1 Tax=Pseudochelatococcus sp. TaxID=2020869 RepID=UPI003D8F5494
MPTITGLFDTYDDARRAVADLEAAGVDSGDISIISHDERADAGNLAAEGAGTGAGLGAVAGGAGGLLAGLGLVAIPGVGPVVAAGWLVATLSGAAAGAVAGGVAGGLIGALTESGIPEGEAEFYAEGVRRGGTIVVARVNEAHVDAATVILSQSNAVDPQARRRAFEGEGWTHFDEGAPLYTPEERQRLRERYRNPL